MKVLVFNCGSSSIKYRVFDEPENRAVAGGLIERVGESQSRIVHESAGKLAKKTEYVRDHQRGLEIIAGLLTDGQDAPIESLSEIGACAHRVVHGGEEVTGSVFVDDNMIATIERHASLAPLHNPPNLVGIREAMRLFSGIPQVACFDTAFHQTLPEKAYRYALPDEIYTKLRVRKYGFHGTSHRYVARRAARIMGREKYDVNLITCHLGSGSSITAIRQGRSVDTSMGMTPLEGLVMGTRPGDIDPGIVFYLERKGYSTSDLDVLLNRNSGLKGLSGISNDVRDLEARASKGDAMASVALDVFGYRLKKYIGAYLAVLNGCDAVVFTAGIGENDALMRKRALENMESLGIVLDDDKNARTIGKEGSIESEKSLIRVLVIPTDEEVAMARDAYTIAASREHVP